MIQRVQSIYLLLVTILMSFLLMRPYAEITLTQGQALIFHSLTIERYTPPDTFEKYRTTLPLFLMIIITGAVSFANIFLFNRRIVQIRLCFVSFILLAVILIIMFIYYSSARGALDYTLHVFRLAAVFPILAIVMTFLAYRAINHDELLVSSYKRIR
jgi:hypothetical protein